MREVTQEELGVVVVRSKHNVGMCETQTAN